MNIHPSNSSFVLQADSGVLSSIQVAITSNRLDQVAYEFIQRMLAPYPRTRHELPGIWLIRDATLALLVGCVLGLAAFGLFGHDFVQTHTPAAAIPVLHEASAPNNPPTAINHPDIASRDPALEEARLAGLLNAGLSRRMALLKSSPRSVGYRALLKNGWQHYRQARYHLASVDFGRAVHMNPRQTDGYYGLALSLFEQGNESAALRTLESGARKTGPKAAIWVLAGSIYQWMGKESAARKMYRRYIKRHPQGAFAGDVKALLSRKHLPTLVETPEQLTVNPLR